jgi:positive phototaxis protein PixI
MNQPMALTVVNESLEGPADVHRFLRFQLGNDDTGLLPVDGVLQVLSIDVGEILPVPQMPSSVLGVYNWRGDMLWLVDFQKLVGLPPIFATHQENQNWMTIVINIQQKVIGLVVKQVDDIEPRDRREILPIKPGLFAAELIQFLQGYFITAEHQMLMVFDGETIINSSILQAPRM